MSSMKVSKGALRLIETSPNEFSFKEEEDGTKKFNIVGYSGGVIKNHWFWGNLGIELNGLQFPKDKYPILRDHQTDKEIGFASKPIIEGNLHFTQDEVTLLDNEEAQKFVDNAKAGFPYQASIYAIPTKLERVESGESVEVNGTTLEGPGTVWREATFKECSVCVFGADSNTSANAFTDDETIDLMVESIGGNTDNNQSDDNGGTQMDISKLKEDHPELYAELLAEGETAAAEKFEADLQAKDDEIQSLKAEKDKLSAVASETENRVADLEKREAIRFEESLDAKADAIWIGQLKESDIPEHLHGKVKKMVTRDKFTDDVKFDEAKFTEAIAAEIKDWEDKLTPETIQGIGQFSRSIDDGVDTTDQLKQDSIVDRMLGHTGQATD